MPKQKSEQFIKLCEKYGVDPAQVPEIMTYEEACRITKRNVKVKRDDMQKTMVVIDAFWKALKSKPNYNGGQDRYFPIHYKGKTGLVFSDTDCEGWDSHTNAVVGAPFALPNRPCAAFVGQHFLALYKWKLNYKVQ